MVAGTDADTAIPHIYWIDHLSSMCPLNFAAHGYASYFCMSTMDRYWKEGMSLAEVKGLMRKCMEQLKVTLFCRLFF